MHIIDILIPRLFQKLLISHSMKFICRAVESCNNPGSMDLGEMRNKAVHIRGNSS